jgi:hypothetical protein
MAAFTAPFGAGIAFAGIVPSAGLNSINTDIPKAPNFVDGDATYAPAVGVTVQGAGIFIGGTGWRILSAAQINNYGGSFVGQAAVAGLTATGGAGATGVVGTGGAGGAGGAFTGAGGGNGVTGTGQGAGTGGVFTGGATGPGLYCIGNGGAVALQVAGGNAIFTGSQPAATADPGANGYLASTNICKVWGMISTDGGGAVTLNDGYNISSVTVTATYVEVNFARAFASTNYAPCVSGAEFPSEVPSTDWASRTTSSVRVSFSDFAGGVVNPATNVVRFAIQIMGRQ